MIAEALQKLGGEGHRDDVIAIIQKEAPAGDAQLLRHAAIACFERVAGNPREEGVIFGSRFGPQSHRWTLGYTASRHLAALQQGSGATGAAAAQSASVEVIRAHAAQPKPPRQPR